MIGDVPRGASLRCRFGRHTGQERGGLMVFTCPRCGGDYWQDRDDYRGALAVADAALVRGDRVAARRALADVGRTDLLPVASHVDE